MTQDDILDLVGGARAYYVWDAQKVRGSQSPEKKALTTRRIWLAAALIAAMLLLVGCTVACARGWFTEFFSARSNVPLSDSQIDFIQENEQIIQETQAKGGWTVELKSTFCSGDIAYAIFTITAPEDINLEEANIVTPNDSDGFIPGNSGMTSQGRRFFSTSLDKDRPELNVVWSYGTDWQQDNDGKPNTATYAVSIQADSMISGEDMLLEDPFGPEVEFYICFDNFIHTWMDPEVWQVIQAEHAGEDYIICGEETEGLYKFEVLVEEEWDFTITFEGTSQSKEGLELISDYALTWAHVSWKLDDEPMFYRTGKGLAPVKITSFVLTPMGATIEYEFEEPMINAFIEYQHFFGYEDRSVYAVMKDGRKIALHTDGTGDKLTAESPIILSELDHVLLGDGGKLTADGLWIEPILY